ncbi:MAG: hypothetical protein M3198_12935 [Actinomycetota bacterium]|nr:hypothetical protein [Actinomycetota bacterium]
MKDGKGGARRSRSAPFYLALLGVLAATTVGLDASGDLKVLAGEGAATAQGASVVGDLDEPPTPAPAEDASSSESGLVDRSEDEAISREDYEVIRPTEEPPTEEPPVEEPVTEEPVTEEPPTEEPPLEEKVVPPTEQPPTEGPVTPPSPQAPEDTSDPGENGPQQDKSNLPAEDEQSSDKPTPDVPTETPADEESNEPGSDDAPGPSPTETDAANPDEDESAAPDTSDGPNDETLLPKWLRSEPTSAELLPENQERSELVNSVHDPSELDLSLRAVTESVLLAALLMLLVGFPSEMFNATLLENYEEISGWFAWTWIERLRTWMSRLSTVTIAVAFSAAGALIHAQLDPDFGLDKGSMALLLGLFLTFLIISVVYDVMRRIHLNRQHDLPSKLRAQVVGMIVAAVLVLASRLGDFHPGYMYGLFTALAYGGVLHERHHGKALAKASLRIFAFALVAWIVWIPVKHAAEEPNAAFWILTLDAMLAVLWVAGVATIVFGLAPLRFFYGETVKAWSFWGWAGLWGTGVVVFVYTLLHPERGLYGSSEEASLGSVLALFIGFAVFSLAFWGYFRIRQSRRDLPAGATQA